MKFRWDITLNEWTIPDEHPCDKYVAPAADLRSYTVSIYDFLVVGLS
jgi:hypothetical protein